MAIAYHNQYVLQGGTSTVTMIPPASTAAGMMGIIFLSNKNSSSDPTDPGDGWTRIPSGSAVVGTGADGVGTGQLRMTAWYKVFTGVQSNTGITVTGGNSIMAGGMVYTKGAGETWAVPTISFGSDTSSGTAFSATVAANLGLLVGEYMLAVSVLTLNTSIGSRPQTIPGVTKTTTGINSGPSTNGNRQFLWTDHSVSTAGSQSGASSSGTTTGAATTGGTMHIRIGLQSTTPVTATRATTWRVAAQVTSSRAAIFDTLALTTGTRATTWDILTPVAATRSTTWRVRGQVTSTRGTTWGVRARVTSTRASTWRAVARVSTSKAASWDTLTAVSAAKATTWRTSARATSTRSTSWDVTAAVQAARAAIWRARETLTAFRSSTWNVASTITTVTAARSTTWAVKARVSAPRTATWDVLSTASADRVTAWDVLINPTATRAASWRVVAGATSDRATTWRVLERVSSERSTTWAVVFDEVEFTVPETVSAVPRGATQAATVQRLTGTAAHRVFVSTATARSTE